MDKPRLVWRLNRTRIRKVKSFVWNILALFGVILFLRNPPTASAQEDTPTSTSDTSVQGQIVNATTGEYGPEGLEIMLHAWDPSGAASDMIHGTSQPNGRFEMEGVEIQPGLYYAVMAIYEGAAYYSEATQANGSGALKDFLVEIYESTPDDSGMYAGLYHIVFGWAQGGLSVAEIFSLSNAGVRTIADAVVLDDGRKATAIYSIPATAANLSFPSSSPERFIQIDGGYADTQPLVPGEGTAQVIASYVLPYEDSLTLDRPVPLDVEEIRILFPHQLGTLEFEVQGGEYLGVEEFGQSSQEYEVYAFGPIEGGGQVMFTVTGSPPVDGYDNAENNTRSMNAERSAGTGILVGSFVLGLALIGTGIWIFVKDKRGVVYDDPDLDEADEIAPEPD
jgi:hypothetical protein